jgi:ArsR family transcriptional regulator
MYLQLFEQHAELFKALAHPRRLEIVNLLRDQELPVTDIHIMLDLPQANISQHLKILREAKIVTTHRDGKQVYYQVGDSRITAACDLLRELLVHQTEVTLVKDPVCDMSVSPKTAGFHHTHNAHQYYFCASGCLQLFKKEPAKYVRQ